MLLQRVAAELLKRYCDHLYNYRKREYIEPRLELRELTSDDDNLPQDAFYQLIVDGDEEQVIQGIDRSRRSWKREKMSCCKLGAYALVILAGTCSNRFFMSDAAAKLTFFR